MRVRNLAIICATFVITCLLTGLGHCDTSSKHGNSLGVQIPYENPFIYEMGSIGRVEVLGNGNKQYTQISIHPSYVYQTYTDELLLCGNQEDYLMEHRGVLVITYERQDHQQYRGVGCHELERVDQVQEKFLGEE